MALEYTKRGPSQPSLYDPIDRQVDYVFCLPENIEMTHTVDGILVFVQGFGQNIHSKVIKKMRHTFADEFNVLTLEVAYFGWEYMQNEPLIEYADNFCDMGPVQAMDHLIALKYVVDFLEKKGIVINKKNVIASGFSHGAYLSYLMNALMPGVLSCIIDNSAWTYPVYITRDRLLYSIDVEGRRKENRFHYIVGEFVMDSNIYNLDFMYSQFKNACNVIAFHGVKDRLAPIESKYDLISKIENSSLEIIDDNRLDGSIFSSADHGLGSDFMEFLRYTKNRYSTISDKEVLKFEDRAFETSVCLYEISNEDGIPILYYKPKHAYNYEKIKKYLRK